MTALPLYSQTQTAQTYQPAAISPAVQKALAHIRAADLRGDLSFLASDALAGRYTPSPGLDIAAEFIASQFRAAGLQPGGDHDYFQVASMVDRKMPKPPKPMSFQSDDGEQFTVAPEAIAVIASSSSVRLDRCPVVIANQQTPEALQGLDLAGKVLLAPAISFGSVAADERGAVVSNMRAFNKIVDVSGAKALLLAGRIPRSAKSLLSVGQAEQQAKVPVVIVHSDDLQKWITTPHATPRKSVSFEIPAPEDIHVQLKNVIAVLPGSDPKLKNTYVMLTAHYDHIGTVETGRELSETKDTSSADQIYNGANDDGSGTVSVIEIAKSLARLQPHPKRSVVFMAFFGEERGDIGSTYYGDHPVFSIAKTVADLNLEQVGRTDSTEGKHVGDASVTGYDYSDVTKYLERAGRQMGVRVYREDPASDDYFVRSDNAALAELGVPAHTLCVAFDYSDYHGLGDEWQKVDYENMAHVDRMVALGLINIANNPIAPKWNSSNPKTTPFREAQRKQHR